MKDHQNKILLAADGSDQSLDAVKYISKILPPRQNEVVIYCVSNKVSESFLELGGTAEFHSKIAPIEAWLSQQKKFIDDFMEKARKIFIDAGFNQKMIKTVVEPRKTGIARDILNEAQKGYHTVVVGRTGISKFKDIILGSVASKLIGKLHHIPLVVVGGKPETDKILMAFDGSEGAKKGVDYIGNMFGYSQQQVLLCHVIRPLSVLQKGYGQVFSPELESEWVAANKNEIEPELVKAKKNLVEMGLSSNLISSKILSDKASRAAGIITEADIGNYGTIVVGRRGLTAVKEFFIGRVSKKILNMASKKAVWIVS